MNPREFYDLAEALCACDRLGDCTEASRNRSAVSRYYYASFLRARAAILSAREIKISKGRAHQTVARAIAGIRNDHQACAVGRSLADLRDLRAAADYELSKVTSRASVEEARGLADKIEAGLQLIDLSRCKDVERGED